MLNKIRMDKETFCENIEKEVIDFIEKNHFFSESDRILVAVSGGKDSTALLHILNKYYNNQIFAVTVDSFIEDYNEINIKNLKEVCEQEKIELEIVSMKQAVGFDLYEMKERLESVGKGVNYCTICGVFKRWLLNKYAKDNDFDVIATGHNKDDIAQCVLMNLFRDKIELLGSIGATSGLRQDNKFVKRIKPLYNIAEEDLKKYNEIKKFPVNFEHCPLSNDGYRKFMKDQLNKLEEKIPEIKKNLLNFELGLIDKVKKKYITNEEIGECRVCKEPARNQICAACNLIQIVNGN
jgi:tRNA-5-methyluridine54 2-sulfurtransferase